jgi:CheY-like chemotaxis protein
MGSQEEFPSHTWQPDQSIPSQETPPITSRRPGLLVVDDDLSMRTLLNAGLWQHGFMVWLAGNGLQALELYQELWADIDLVLLDIHMPGLDGPRTLMALQQLNPAICCCFISGNTAPYTEAALFERGAVRVLQKPFRMPEIAHLLWELVDPSRTKKTLR